MRLTPEQYNALIKNRAKTESKPRVAHRPRQIPGQMNKTEQAFANLYLEPKVRTGELLEWKFEPVSLRLADNTFYRPDFMAIYPDRICIYEVKGTFARDDAIAKWKIAADMYWYWEFKMAFVKMSKGAIKEIDWREYK